MQIICVLEPKVLFKCSERCFLIASNFQQLQTNYLIYFVSFRLVLLAFCFCPCDKFYTYFYLRSRAFTIYTLNLFPENLLKENGRTEEKWKFKKKYRKLEREKHCF